MDRQLAELAEKQHGVVTRAQLRDLDVTGAAVDSAMRVPRHQEIHVTAKRRNGPRGVVVHESRNLTGADVTVERFVPVTTRPRTVIDCADLVSYPELRALADHGVRMDVDAVRRAQERAPGRRGAGSVARLIASDPRTRSKLERAMRRICLTIGAPRPEINGRVLGIERDFVWRAQRLVVETDGGTFHLPKPARERTTRTTRDLSSPAGGSCASAMTRCCTSMRRSPRASRSSCSQSAPQVDGP